MGPGTVFPANAGVILVDDLLTTYPDRVPRECGGDPTEKAIQAVDRRSR
ncbi:hypothetical protein [Mycobacterium botniense]